MRRISARIIAAALAITASQRAVYAQPPPPPTPDELLAPAVRPGFTTFSGDTGLFIVPSADIVRPQGFSLSIGRFNSEYREGTADVSDFVLSVGAAIHPRIEAFGAWKAQTRIDADATPVRSTGTPRDLPFVKAGWTTGFGDSYVGAKAQLLTERQSPVTVAARAVLKLPTGDSLTGLSSGRPDVDIGAALSSELLGRFGFVGQASYLRRGQSPRLTVGGATRLGAGVRFPMWSRLQASIEYSLEKPTSRRLAVADGFGTTDERLDTRQIGVAGLHFAMSRRLWLGGALIVGATDPAASGHRGIDAIIRLAYHPGSNSAYVKTAETDPRLRVRARHIGDVPPPQLTPAPLEPVPLSAVTVPMIAALGSTLPALEGALARTGTVTNESAHNLEIVSRRNPISLLTAGRFAGYQYGVTYGATEAAIIPLRPGISVTTGRSVCESGNAELRAYARIDWQVPATTWDTRITTESRVLTPCGLGSGNAGAETDASLYAHAQLSRGRQRLSDTIGRLDAVGALNGAWRSFEQMLSRTPLAFAPVGVALYPFRNGVDAIRTAGAFVGSLTFNPAQVEPQSSVGDLPPPSHASDATPHGVHIGLDRHVPFQQATVALRQRLVGDVLNVGHRYVQIIDVAAAGQGDTGLLSVRIAGAADGRLQLTSPLEYDLSANMLSLSEVTPTKESTDAYNARRAPWLGAGELEAVLQEAARFTPAPDSENPLGDASEFLSSTIDDVVSRARMDTVDTLDVKAVADRTIDDRFTVRLTLDGAAEVLPVRWFPDLAAGVDVSAMIAPLVATEPPFIWTQRVQTPVAEFKKQVERALLTAVATLVAQDPSLVLLDHEILFEPIVADFNRRLVRLRLSFSKGGIAIPPVWIDGVPSIEQAETHTLVVLKFAAAPPEFTPNTVRIVDLGEGVVEAAAILDDENFWIYRR